MKCYFSCAAMLLAAFGSSADGRSKSKKVDVAVLMEFEDDQSAVSNFEMKRELQSIVDSSHVHLDWHVLRKGAKMQTFPELVVVKFKGTCKMDGLAAPHYQPGVLACSHASDGQVLPFIDVECDRIRNLVGSVSRNVDGARREYLLGRALGRVLAHEFYHVFAKTTKHGEGGIAKPSFNATDLLSDHFTLDAKDRQDLRFGLR